MGTRKPQAFTSDRLIGISKPPRIDELSKCNAPGEPWYTKDTGEFIRVWCSACKFTECVRSQGGKMPWVKRMQDQPDYLINDPIFSDLLSHAHRVIAEGDFPQRNAAAERLEIAEQKQDWTIPDPQTPLIPVGLDKEAPPPSFDDPEPTPEPEPEPVSIPIAELEAPLIPKPAPLPAKRANTPMPKGGLLIGPPPPPQDDPWTPRPNQTMILPGATVVLK